MIKSRPVEVVCTARDTDNRLTETTPLTLETTPTSDAPSVLIDTQKQFQTMIGFGGAFTEAAAVTLDRLPPHLRREALDAYFAPDRGHGYTFCRTHINSCDFSAGNYAYTEVDGDVALEYFSIDRDRRALIPMIREAIDCADGALQLFATPWSPPAWMKTNGRMTRGGKLKPEYRTAWANYFVRYILAYAGEGIPISGLTVQNEPEAVQTWESCIYTGEEERDFVRDFLGPALHSAGMDDIKLIIWDHNRDRMFERAKIVLDDPETARYVWGVGFHWYDSDNFNNVQLVHDAYPDKHLVFTEGCQEGGPHLGSWDLGERYAHSMIEDLNRWTVAWVDWNLLLDETGGPNHVGNLCSAPIIVDTQRQQLHYQSSYYYIGHFSRFIRPGARRVLCATTLDALEATAFLNPDGSIAVIVLNRTDEQLAFALKHGGQQALTEIPAHSIKTFQFESFDH